MVSFTPKYSLPYVVGVDYVANYPNTVSKPLAERIEAAIVELTETTETQINDLAGTTESELKETNDSVSELNAILTNLIPAFNNQLLDLTYTETATLNSSFTEIFAKVNLNRYGRLVQVQGVTRFTNVDLAGGSHYNIVNIPLWAWAKNEDEIVLDAYAKPPNGADYEPAMAYLRGNNIYISGPIAKGTEVVLSGAYLADRDSSATATTADDAGATDTGGDS